MRRLVDVLLVMAVAACASRPPATEAVKSPASTSPIAAVAGPPVPATKIATQAPAPTAAAPQAPAPPKVVLQLGDSFVGGWNGLAKALAPRFEALGAKFVRDWQDSVSIATYDHEHRIEDLIAKNQPDLVLVTLGANDVSVPFPAALAKHVASIAHKVSAGGRACYWLSPPLWKKDTGIVDVIKQNAAPCKVFDGSNIKLSRGGDGIHPNDTGGRTWAEAFFVFYNQEAEPPSNVATR
ncbi:MAG TPA: SGNH/GDSL hydrolase family protein [Polyangiaceae bacterium]|jgi:acyl-CoA thioesterase-1